MTLKSFSETTAARIMRQLLCAVAYCHARNIVHRYDFPLDANAVGTSSPRIWS